MKAKKYIRFSPPALRFFAKNGKSRKKRTRNLITDSLQPRMLNMRLLFGHVSIAAKGVKVNHESFSVFAYKQRRLSTLSLYVYRFFAFFPSLPWIFPSLLLLPPCTQKPHEAAVSSCFLEMFILRFFSLLLVFLAPSWGTDAMGILSHKWLRVSQGR
jgi:hypothetical protein